MADIKKQVSDLVSVASNPLKFENTLILTKNDVAIAYADQIKDAYHDNKWQSEINEELYNAIKGAVGAIEYQGTIIDNSDALSKIDASTVNNGYLWIVDPQVLDTKSNTYTNIESFDLSLELKITDEDSGTTSTVKFEKTVKRGYWILLANKDEASWAKRITIIEMDMTNSVTAGDGNVGSVHQATYVLNNVIKAGLTTESFTESTTASDGTKTDNRAFDNKTYKDIDSEISALNTTEDLLTKGYSDSSGNIYVSVAPITKATLDSLLA